MLSKTKLGLITLVIVALLIFLPNISTFLGGSQTFKFDFIKAFNIKPQSNALKQIVEKDLQDQRGKYAVLIEGLNDDEYYALNEQEVFPAASLYKLVLMAAVYKEVQEGSLNLDQTVYSTKSHLIDVLGEEDFGYEDVPEDIGYSVEEAITRVATISDNYAAIMLTEKIRRINQSSGPEDNNDPLVMMANDLGMVQTTFGSDQVYTIVEDIGHFFKLLYLGKVVNKDVSDQIISLLSKSKLNDRIPAQIPKEMEVKKEDGSTDKQELKIAHKTGELAKVRHDAGIVFLPNHPYLIVLMSQDLQYEDDAVETLASLSKDVFDYFSGK